MSFDDVHINTRTNIKDLNTTLKSSILHWMIRYLDETLYGSIQYKTNSPDRSSGSLTLAGSMAGPSSREEYFSAIASRLYRLEEQLTGRSRVALSLLGPQEETDNVLLFTRSRIEMRMNNNRSMEAK